MQLSESTIASWQQARASRDKRYDGQFFVAVKTTGIFCRPICPARLPKEQNVLYFHLAQQAIQNGYRPCLRCRPESAPGSWRWKGTDTTLERAMQILCTELATPLESLSDRLGVTSRYLRKLFQNKVGCSPKTYQLSECLMFAKQLLHETQLPIEQIAIASGFNAARGLQYHLKQVTGLTPSQIRSNKQVPSTQLNLFLSYRPPYDWQHFSAFLKQRRIESIEQCDASSYSRSFKLNDAYGQFKANWLPERQGFKIELKISQINQLKAVIENIKRIFDLDANTCIIAQQLQRAGLTDSQISHGLRLPGIWDQYEAGCRAILGQQVSVKAAIGVLNTLVEQLGYKKDSLIFFPEPDAVANSDLAFLRMPQSRKQALRDFSHLYAAKANPTAQDWLAIKGIGPWTADYIKMRGMSEPDVGLSKDLIIKQQLQAHPDIDPDKARPWRSYLNLQLWNNA